jgi:AraC family transcriptional regulator
MFAGGPFLFRYEAGFRVDDAHLQSTVSIVLDGVHRQIDDARISHDLQPGSLCYMPADAPHEHFAGPTGTLVVSVAIPKSAESSQTPFSQHGHAAVKPMLSLLAAAAACDSAALLDREAWTEEILAALSDRKTQASHGRWIETVREMLYEQSDRDLTLGDLCDVVGYDRCHVARVFRANYGQSLGDYLREVRLSKAASQLACEQETTIAEAAVRAGFYDQAHFCRAFRKRFGHSPVSWRQALSANATPVQG